MIMPRQKKWFHVEEKGSLLEFGYSPKKATSTRRRAIRDAINSRKHDALEVFRKLNGLANVTQHSQKSNSRVYKRDANWVSNNYL